MLEFWIHISPLGTFLATLAWFLLGLPAMVAAFYQAWKARQEAKAMREGRLHSANCLEFVAGNGSCINLVPLETLHSLPKPGDVVMLPGCVEWAGMGSFLRARILWVGLSSSTRTCGVQE